MEVRNRRLENIYYEEFYVRAHYEDQIRVKEIHIIDNKNKNSIKPNGPVEVKDNIVLVLNY
jgi:hypothetical protein